VFDNTNSKCGLYNCMPLLGEVTHGRAFLLAVVSVVVCCKVWGRTGIGNGTPTSDSIKQFTEHIRACRKVPSLHESGLRSGAVGVILKMNAGEFG
jgi:hypothetical protein